MKNIIIIMLMTFSSMAFADVSLKSQLGFTATLPDGWFVLSPTQLQTELKDQDLKSLGIPESVDQALVLELLNKIKGGNVEYYYDELYITKENKNHISVQIGHPINYTSIDEVNKDCEGVPNQLNEVFGQTVEVLVCSLEMSLDRQYFHLGYKLPSNGLTIIHDKVFVNNQYSLEVVGASANDMDGLKRVMIAQHKMVTSITSHLASMAPAKPAEPVVPVK